MKTDISVIIPVHNSENTIDILIDSIKSQTKNKVEYIFVDDSSSDDTFALLKKRETENNALTVIKNKGMKGKPGCVVYGLLKSKGKYVMIAEDSFSLLPEYCEKAYELIREKNADVAQFLPDIRTDDNYFESDSNDAVTKMHISSKEISCTEGSLFSLEGWKGLFNPQFICNKIYNGNLARETAKEIDSNNLNTDWYGFGALFSMRAVSYIGDNTSLYINEQTNYDNTDILSPDYQNGVKMFCNYLEEKKATYDENEKQCILNLRRHYILDAIDRSLEHFDKETKSGLINEMINIWGLESFVDAISVISVQKRSDLAEAFRNVDYFKAKKRDTDKKKTIASYYMKLSNGGIERVMSTLCSMLAEIKDEKGNYKYNVIIITDEEDDSKEKIPSYSYSALVKREYLPVVENGKQFAMRYREWQRILSQNDVDIVIGNRWSADFFPDAVCIKGSENKPTLINHFHYSLTDMYGIRSSLAEYQSQFFGFIDGVVLLSHSDERLARVFGKHVRYIPNPMPFMPDRNSVVPEKNAILWAARFAKMKQPLEIVKVMEQVVKDIPEAKLYMVGTGESETVDVIRRSIARKHLENNIELCGYSDKMEDYYNKASVFTLTSHTEGYPMTLIEAASFGIPIVLYDMPWTSMVEDGRGLITVPQNRYDLMADEVVRILKDDEYRNSLSDLAFQHALDLAKTDIIGEWEELFREINEESQDKDSGSREDLLFELITRNQNQAKLSWQKNYETEKKKADYYFKKMEECVKSAERMQEQASANWKAREEAQAKQEYAWQKRNEAIELANKMQAEAAANWEARNKALEQASANWKAREEAQAKQEYAWQKRNEAIEAKRELQKAKNELDKQYEELEKQFSEQHDNYIELENENIELREQALEMQARLDEMQKEYDDLETQLITLAKKYRELTEHWSYKVFGKKK